MPANKITDKLKLSPIEETEIVNAAKKLSKFDYFSYNFIMSKLGLFGILALIFLSVWLLSPLLSIVCSAIVIPGIIAASFQKFMNFENKLNKLKESIINQNEKSLLYDNLPNEHVSILKKHLNNRIKS